uniref:Uncharacterized protein n=2 Tax=Rhinopithecus TaxID=542827 RepID=A0A2K6N661_RHIBE
MTTIHELLLFMKLNTVMCCLTAGIHSEKCIVRQFRCANNIHSPQHTQAIW